MSFLSAIFSAAKRYLYALYSFVFVLNMDDPMETEGAGPVDQPVNPGASQGLQPVPQVQPVMQAAGQVAATVPIAPPAPPALPLTALSAPVPLVPTLAPASTPVAPLNLPAATMGTANPNFPVPFVTVVNPEAASMAAQPMPGSSSNPTLAATQNAPNPLLSQLVAHLNTPEVTNALVAALAQVAAQTQTQAAVNPRSVPVGGSASVVPVIPAVTPAVTAPVGVVGVARPQVPDKYTGDPANEGAYSVHTFLFAVSNYLTLAREEIDSRKLAFAVTCLSDRALAYWLDYTRKLSPERLAALTYDDFENELRMQFGGAKTEFVYHTELRNLKQTSTMRAYVNEFMRLDSLIRIQPLSDGGRIFQFLEGLTPEFRDRLLTQPNGKPWIEPAALYDYAETIAAGHDARFNDTKRRTNANNAMNSASNMNSNGNGRSAFAAGNSGSKKNYGNFGKRAPVDQGDRQAKKPADGSKVPPEQWLANTRAMQADFKRLGRCFACGEKGHITRACKKEGEALKKAQNDYRKGN